MPRPYYMSLGSRELRPTSSREHGGSNSTTSSDDECAWSPWCPWSDEVTAEGKLAREQDIEGIVHAAKQYPSDASRGMPKDQRFHRSEMAYTVYMTLWEMQHQPHQRLELPADTVVSASIVMPMIARSTGHGITITAIALKMAFLTVVCLYLQSEILFSLVKARKLLPSIDGRPNLCSYGQDPGNNSKPIGPAGLQMERNSGNIEPDFSMFMLRNTLAEVLRRVNVSNPGIGPVEYGMESSSCRVMCVAIFCIAIMFECFTFWDIMVFVWHVPSLPMRMADTDPNDALWVSFQDEFEERDVDRLSKEPPEVQEQVKKPTKKQTHLDHVDFRANGVPRVFKVLWAWPVMFARLWIIAQVFWAGLNLLMNTGGIVDLIMNSLALTFVIELDSLLFSTFARGRTKDMLQRLQPFKIKPEKFDAEEKLGAMIEREFHWWPSRCTALFCKVLEMSSSLVILVTFVVCAHYAYFAAFCTLEGWPFNATDWFGTAYFDGMTRRFGGWEFVLGSWRSGTIVDPQGIVTCVPAAGAAGQTTAPNGCGLPQPWSPTR